MSDSLVDVAFEESITNIKDSLKCIIRDDSCGVKTLNSSRKILGEYYPDMVIGMTLDLQCQGLIFESIFKLILSDNVMVLTPSSETTPVPNRSGVRLVRLINSDRNATIILMDPILRTLVCQDYSLVTRSAFRRLVSTPFEFNDIKFGLEKSILRIIVLLYDSWKDINSQFNDPAVQRKPEAVLISARNNIMLVFEKYSKLIIEKYPDDSDIFTFMNRGSPGVDAEPEDDAEKMMTKIRTGRAAVHGATLRESLSVPHPNYGVLSVEDE